MGRTPNDDRSDSMNPNNPAYDASESNRLNQIGANYDDDDYSPGGPSGLSFSYYSEPMAPASPPVVEELELIVAPQPVRVSGLYLLIVSNDEKQRCVKVDAGAIEEAVKDAKTIWDSRHLAYLALYDNKNIYLERTRSKQFSPDVLQSSIELDELEKLILFASSEIRSARRALNQVAGSPDGQHAVARFLRRYGASYSALQGLRAERSERIEDLRARGYEVSGETAGEFGHEGKLAKVVDANAQWVRDFQSGKADFDPMVRAFSRPERILDIKA
ncbi:hypothetical protein FVF58_43640 [Paraburkholderia panacisoli]|uniref:Uncharacterized protein n=1 Tax=Paraburkholderia panacisoli TaxID=2603818 RepID=A0A5B0G5X3_9BURK|nr:hypothetical protein [Paraburkholderia panacisoli]KAA0998622.1 hypothetical protein FVF58_43640 [Paraburkholderia panacisoli]